MIVEAKSFPMHNSNHHTNSMVWKIKFTKSRVCLKYRFDMKQREHCAGGGSQENLWKVD